MSSEPDGGIDSAGSSMVSSGLGRSNEELSVWLNSQSAEVFSSSGS